MPEIWWKTLMIWSLLSARLVQDIFKIKYSSHQIIFFLMLLLTCPWIYPWITSWIWFYLFLLLHPGQYNRCWKLPVLLPVEILTLVPLLVMFSIWKWRHALEAYSNCYPHRLGHSVNSNLFLLLIYMTHMYLWKHGYFLAQWPSDTLRLSTYPLLIKRAQANGTDHNYKCLLTVQLLLLIAVVSP